MIDFIFITNDPIQAGCAERAGVDRIMVDLEILGKANRQGHLDTVISNHTLDDVHIVRNVITKSALMVRVNPIYPDSAEEISRVLDYGADIVMLPMFKLTKEVESFIKIVQGRARVCLLLETSESLGRAEQILSIPGIDEVHVGLNDLHLALGLDFMFEVLSGGLVDHIAHLCRARGIKFGFGGVARAGRGMLSANEIISEHARIGSSQVILSRDFRSLFDGRSEDSVTREFHEKIKELRIIYNNSLEKNDMQLSIIKNRVSQHITAILSND